VVDTPIFITGFMGVGKSRIGRLLAERLRWSFVDTDQLIQEQAGLSISDIFARQGEDAFRDLEHNCIQAVASRSCVVVSLGGGAIVPERNRQRIRAAGLLVCITADVDTILRRVGRREDRPLLAGLNAVGRRQRVEQLLAERQPFYAQADITIESCDDRAPDETARALLRAIEQWYADHPTESC
jgi:shikimate kinase